MGAEDRAPPGKADDDWFKQAAGRWERQKAEEKARAEKPAPQENTNVEDDLRQMAANEAAAKKSREESLAPTMIALPKAAPARRLRRGRQWWAAGAVGVAAVVLSALLFWPRAKPAAAPPTGTPALPAAAGPAPPAAEPPPPAAPPAPPTPVQPKA